MRVRVRPRPGGVNDISRQRGGVVMMPAPSKKHADVQSVATTQLDNN